MTLATEELPDTTTEEPPPESPPDAVIIAPTLSPEDLEFVKRRPKVLESMAAVQAARHDLDDATGALEHAKKHHKGMEAALEAANNALFAALNDQPQLSATPLFDNAAPAATQPTDEAVQAWEAQWQTFLGQSIDVLDVPDSLKEKLREHKPEPIKTLNDLVMIKAVEPVRGYTSIAGVGEAKADQLDDAFEKLQAAFLQSRPNPTPATTDAPATESADRPATDYDFETTFPAPVNPTQNETYDAGYHQEVIRDSIAELTELRAAKEQREKGGLPEKKLNKLHDKIAELQVQYDQGFDIYAERFGPQAAERLRAFVEAKVDHQASLKGGLD